LEKLTKYKEYNVKYIKYEKSTIRKDKSKDIRRNIFSTCETQGNTYI